MQSHSHNAFMWLKQLSIILSRFEGLSVYRHKIKSRAHDDGQSLHRLSASVGSLGATFIGSFSGVLVTVGAAVNKNILV